MSFEPGDGWDYLRKLRGVQPKKRGRPTITIRSFRDIDSDIDKVREIFTKGMISTISSGLQWKLVTGKYAAAYVVLIAVLCCFEFAKVFFVWTLAVALLVGVLIMLPSSIARGYVQEAIVKKDLKDIHAHYILNPRSHFWVAVTGRDEVKGCVAVEEIIKDNSDGWLVGDAELRRMSVDWSCQGFGISRQLFDALKAFCKEKGYKRIVLTTSEMQSAACAMYPKVGSMLFFDLHCLPLPCIAHSILIQLAFPCSSASSCSRHPSGRASWKSSFSRLICRHWALLTT
jgi:GNAT superfamily N-acetyltransferase